MEPLLREQEVIARYRVSRETLRRLRALGILRAVHFGRAVRFDPKDVEAAVETLKSP